MENYISSVDLINRRKFDRFEFHDEFVIEGEKFQTIPSVASKNVSQKGAFLTLSQPMEIGSIITAELPTAKLHLIAEVRWTKKDNEQYGIGIVFHELFPQTKQKITDLIHHIQVESKKIQQNSFSSLDFEQMVSAFLDRYIDDVRPEPVESYPTMNRRLNTPIEKSLSFYTPSKSRMMELTTSSFRIHQEKTESMKSKIPARKLAFLAALLATAGLYFASRNGFVENSIKQLAQKPVAETTGVPNKIAVTEASFNEGLLEKVSWSTIASRTELTLSFRDIVTPEQVQFESIRTDQPRELVKIMNVDPKLDQKTIYSVNSMINQIRVGLHDEQGQTNLHIVMDLKNPNIQIISKSQTEKTLKLVLSGGASSTVQH